ncbi:unnamed protein product [Phaedon cochleariae]|uniref:SH3 domain-containing protein n=1 Tax=Phaedon cochleariae TaxID=80249 RepID=A0A9P0DKR2_PHACE|nr:unnamed protein product [Phaedon cochleariae]
MSFIAQSKLVQKNKRKPPPRPPPPNFSKYRSESTFSFNQQFEDLIDLSPPQSPKVERIHNFGGSVSSSFNSSTSSLASSKKSFEYDIPLSNNLWPISTNFDSSKQVVHNKQNNFPTRVAPRQASDNGKVLGKVSNPIVDIVSTSKLNNQSQQSMPSLFGPTIIRAQTPKNRMSHENNINRGIESDPQSSTLPMPSVPPPSPPKEVQHINLSYGIALFDFNGVEPADLSFQAEDVVILLKRINNDWYYGRLLDKEGIFPANFIDVIVPLNQDDKTVMALYEFSPQMPGDLGLRAGQMVKVIRKINVDWLYGESEGQCGQFPSNFVDRIPQV